MIIQKVTLVQPPGYLRITPSENTNLRYTPFNTGITFDPSSDILRIVARCRIPKQTGGEWSCYLGSGSYDTSGFVLRRNNLTNQSYWLIGGMNSPNYGNDDFATWDMSFEGVKFNGIRTTNSDYIKREKCTEHGPIYIGGTHSRYASIAVTEWQEVRIYKNGTLLLYWLPDESGTFRDFLTSELISKTGNDRVEYLV